MRLGKILEVLCYLIAGYDVAALFLFLRQHNATGDMVAFVTGAVVSIILGLVLSRHPNMNLLLTRHPDVIDEVNAHQERHSATD